MRKILIIDDDVTIGDLEQEVLEREGYAVQRAYSGTEALLLSPKSFETREEFNKVFLEKVDELKPDLIVLAGFLVAKLETVGYNVW